MIYQYYRLLDAEVASGAMQKMASDHEMNVEEFPPLLLPRASTIQSPATPPPAMYSPATPPPAIYPPATPPPAIRCLATFKILNLAEWGQHHPDHRPEALRVRWTVEEETFIADFVAQFPTATLKECYTYVVQSISAKDVFHPNHVCSHMRLEHAFKKVKKARSSVAITSAYEV
jgi:hypothetical protein